MKLIYVVNIPDLIHFQGMHNTDLMTVKRHQFVHTQNLMRSKLLAQASISYTLRTEVEVDMSTHFASS